MTEEPPFELLNKEDGVWQRFANWDEDGEYLIHLGPFDQVAEIMAGFIGRGWQPIETAPRDGTEILGWRADAGTLLVRWTALAEFLTDAELDEFDEDTAHQEDWFYADFVHGDRLEHENVPTHWMPLPGKPVV